jgi:Icc-related predicted phosphoesterase
MKILAVSDIHNSEEGLEFVIDLISSARPDLALICGDVTTFGPESFAREAITSFPVKTFAVPGNCDPPAIHPILDQGKSTNIHGKMIEYKGFKFVGWGGSNITGLNTPFENPESVISTNLEPLIKSELRSIRSENSNSPNASSDIETPNMILLSHCPPSGYQDYVPSLSRGVGSTAIESILNIFRVPLTVCGHVHEDQGVQIDGDKRLIVVNVGSAKMHCAALIELKSPDEVVADPINNINFEIIS